MKDIKHIKITTPGLNEVINFVNSCIPYFEENNIKDLTKYLESEDELFSNLTIRELENFISEANQYTRSTDSSLLSDLADAYSYNAVIERIVFLANIKLYTKLNYCVKENKPLFDALKQRYFIINDFEYELRKVFLNLLAKHIEASDKMSNNYLFVLKSLKVNLNKKYTLYSDNLFKEHIKNIKSYDYDYFVNKYLDEMITTVLVMLSSLTDDRLENESTYAIAISYQILLRSLFIILDDYKRLADYEEYYLGIIGNNTIAKGIIKSAFISNYHDLEEYNLKKTKEN